jgi:hypothetical protein
VALRSQAKTLINRGLAPLGLRLQTRTAELAEMARLRRLETAGHFARPAFPVLPQFHACDPKPLLEAVAGFREQTARFARPGRDGGYSFGNDYFTSPDAEIGYALVRQLNPRQIIEVGSGNSTQLFRAAITDGKLRTALVSIDPSPRTAVEAVADRVVMERLEDVPASYLADTLQDGDILFIDSSHQSRTGNDVVELFLKVIPALRAGVVVHVHDVFLPFDYPREWVVEHRWDWNEQYLVQAMLQGSNEFDVLWPAHFLQRTWPEFASHFDETSRDNACSLWLRKIA